MTTGGIPSPRARPQFPAPGQQQPGINVMPTLAEPDDAQNSARMAYAKALLEQSMGPQQIGSWTQGAAQLVNALVGGSMMRKAAGAEDAKKASELAAEQAASGETADMIMGLLPAAQAGGGGGGQQPGSAAQPGPGAGAPQGAPPVDPARLRAFLANPRIPAEAKNKVLGMMTPAEREQFTLGEGQTRFDANGRPIASVPKGPTAEAANPFTLGAGQTRYDAAGNPIASQPGESTTPDFGDQGQLRKEIQALPSYKNFAQALPIYRSMIETAPNNSRASDLNLVYGLGKIFDPGSVVREGEMVMVKDTASLPDWLMGEINRLNGGQALQPATRNAILTEATSRVKGYKQAFDQDVIQYKGIVDRAKLNPADIIPDFGGVPEYQPLPAGPEAAPSPAGPGGGRRAPQPAPAQASPVTPGAPPPGTVEDGYKFKGGDPADPNSWEKVSQRTAPIVPVGVRRTL